MSDNAPLCYLDACAIMFLVDPGNYHDRKNVMVDVLDAAEARRLKLVTSMVSVAEVAFADHEKRNKQLDPQIEAKLDKLWHPASPIRLVEVHDTVIRKARELLRYAASQGVSMGGANDMIHVATALREDATYLFTYDDKVTRWNLHEDLIVCEPTSTIAAAKNAEQQTDLFDGKQHSQPEDQS